jgi:PAS domain S-box-containing protein
MALPPPPALRDPFRLRALRRTGLLDTPPEAAFDRFTRLAVQLLRAPIAAISLVERDRQFIKSGIGLPEPLAAERQAALRHSYCQHVVGSGSALVVEDARTHPLVRDDEGVAETGVAAYLGFPLTTAEGHVLGSLCVADVVPRAWTQEQLRAMEDLASAVIAEIRLRQLDRERGEAREEPDSGDAPFRALVERSADLLLILSVHGQIRYHSPSVQRAMGWESACLMGMSTFEFIHPDDRERARDAFAPLARTHGASAELEFRFRCVDGGWRVLSSHATNLLDHPDVRGILVNARDVTARREAEAELVAGEVRLQRQNRALVELAREQSRPGGNWEECVRRITEATARTLHVDRVGVWLFDPERTRLECVDRYDAGADRHCIGDEVGVAEVPHFCHALRDARTLAADDAATDLAVRRFREAQPARPAPTSTLHAVVRLGGEVVGVVCHDHLGPSRHWTLDEQSFAGSIADMVAVALKWSERRVVQELNRRLASIVEASHDAIFSLSPRGSILSWNPGAERIYGYRVRDIVGGPLTRLLAAGANSEEMYLLGRVAGGEQVEHLDTIHVHRSGRAINVSLTLSAIRNAQGRITSVAAVARDVTERKRAEAALIDAKEAAEAASRTKSDFLSSMSHELRTPLNSVIGFANVLRRNRNGSLQPQEVQYLDRILANGTHLLGLINDLLDLSKIEAGKVELEITTVDLGALILDTLAALQGSIRPGVEVITELPATVAAVESDAGKWKQVLINLVGNALKFTERGSVTVALHTDPHTARPLRVDVRDTGIGIPADQLGSIFQAFQQGEGGTARRFGGTGLGLTITTSLCQLMGYRVTVWSEVGAGTTFSVLLGEPAA